MVTSFKTSDATHAVVTIETDYDGTKFISADPCLNEEHAKEWIETSRRCGDTDPMYITSHMEGEARVHAFYEETGDPFSVKSTKNHCKQMGWDYKEFRKLIDSFKHGKYMKFNA